MADRLPKGDSPEPDEPESPEDYYRPAYFGPLSLAAQSAAPIVQLA